MRISQSGGYIRSALMTAFLSGTVLVVPAISSAQDVGAIKAPKVNSARAELGKRLFFDKRLSGDASMSCASCHQPDKAFTDGLALSKAYPGSKGFRNTPTLMDTALRANWFHDSRVGTNLNDVTRENITEDYIMNMDMRLMQERLKQDPVYVDLFKKAGLGEPSNGGARKAIPEYLKTLISRNAPFDAGKMDADAKLGYALFKGKAGCVACHSGPLFTDDSQHNIGVPENEALWADPMRQMTYTAFASFMGVENYMNLRRDVGAHILGHKADGSDIGTFRTPTLRELKYTAPYMHNGTFGTLFEVVAFYNQGGGNDPNKDKRLKPLGLSYGEQQDLVAFLKSLSGDLLSGPDFVPDKPIPTNYQAIKNWREQTN